MTTRQPGGSYGLTLPGPMPWLGRGGQHPLAAAALAPAASSQPTTMPAPSGRPAPHAQSAAIPLPNFAASQVSLPVYGAAQPLQPATRPVAAHQPAASMRPPIRASQLPASQPHGFHWSQRSQLDNIVVGTQLLPEEEEQGVGDNVATLEVGSAPAAADRYGAAVGPSQPEVSRLPRAAAPSQTVAMAARLLMGQLQSNANQLEDHQALGGLMDKLKEMSGKQSALEASLDKVKGDLAAHSTALEGIGATCAQMLQAVQTIGGTSDGIAAQLQQLLAKPPPAVTGDMATQTSPQLAASAQQGGTVLPSPSQPPANILQTFSQRRPSAAAALVPAVPHAAAVPLPPRGLSADVAAAAAKPITMPTTTPTTSPGSAAAAATAAAPARVAVQARRQQPAAAPTEAPASAGKGAGKPGSGTKRRQPKPASQPAAKRAAQPPAAAKSKPASQPAAEGKPQGSFSRKRPLESSSQQTAQQQPRPSKQQRAVAEALFDSLFDDEQENGAAAVAPQVQLPAKPPAAAAVPACGGKGQPDLAAKVQARLEKHRARFARLRTASQRQLEDEE